MKSPAERRRATPWLPLAVCLLFAAQPLAQVVATVVPGLAPQAAAQLRAPLQRWQQLGPLQQQQARQQWQAWQALTREQQRERLEAWSAWQLLPTGERQAVQAAAQVRAALPADEQRSLRETFDALDTSEQRGWLLGPELGRDWAHLQPLFAQVPAEQREPLLQALRGLNRDQRQSLGVLARRVPPQERAALRAEFLQTAPMQRGQWLRARVGG